MRHVLPTLRLRRDALIYFVQDSLMLRQPLYAYPPPPTFIAASMISFSPSKTFMDPGGGRTLSQNESDAVWVAAAQQALAGVQSTPQRAGVASNAVATTALHGSRRASSATPGWTQPTPRATDAFMGCFGPNFFSSYHGARSLLERGVFDMMHVRTKLDEQVSERVLGWFIGRELNSPCSVAGDITSHLTHCAKLGGCRFGPFEKQLLAHTRGP